MCGHGQWSHPTPTEAGLQRLTQSSRRGPYLGVPDPVGSPPLRWVRGGPASRPRITERACETLGEFSSGRMAGAGKELPGRVCRGSPPPPTNHTTHTAATLFLLTTPAPSQADGHCSGGLRVRPGWHLAPTDEGTEGPCGPAASCEAGAGELASLKHLAQHPVRTESWTSVRWLE